MEKKRCTFSVKIKPKAKSNSVEMKEDGSVEVRVTSPPIENRANEQCIALLAEKLSVPKSSLSIIKGHHSKEKIIACDGLTMEEIKSRLR